MSKQTGILLSALIAELKKDIAPDMTDDSYFELFCNEQILRDYDLSYEEIEQGTIGNGGDGGIDGFFIFANDVLINVDDALPNFKGQLDVEVFIIQSKNQESFSEDVIHKFKSSAEDIFAFDKEIDELSSVYNHDLLTIVDTFRKLYLENLTKNPDLSFNYVYASRGSEIHPNVSRKVETLKVESALSNTSFLEKGEGLNIRYFVYMHFVLSQRKIKERKVTNPKKYLDEFMVLELDNSLINESISKVYEIFNNLGKTDGTAKSKNFTEAVIEDAFQQ